MATEVDGCVDGADTAWVLLSFVLVLVMFPGLALFEAGLLPAKDTLSIFVQTLVGVTALSVMWDVIGYTLVFGPDHSGIIGDFTHAFLYNVPYNDCNKFAPTIPAAAFAMFQMLFASICPLLMTGSFASRFRFWPWLVFTLLWELLVYYPVAHWVWGGGFLQQRGVIDFAGGIVVHVTSGSGAFVCAAMLGRRKDYELHNNGEFPPSNLPLAVTGTGLLFVGWFGFNAGSALKTGSLATSTVASTQIGGCVSALTWMVAASLTGHGLPPGVVAVANGGIAGLAGITPASGFIDNRGTLGLGLVLGLTTWAGNIILKKKLRVDDALEVCVVHGFSGAIGSLATGLLATRSAHPDLVNEGAFYGGGTHLLVAQVEGVLVVCVYSTIVTVALMWLLERLFRSLSGQGLRIDLEGEIVGLDIAEHRETAYHDLEVEMSEEQKALLPMHFGETQVSARRRTSAEISPLRDSINFSEYS